MNIQELKNQLPKGMFYYCTYGALIKVPVKDVVVKSELFAVVKLEHGGFVDIIAGRMKKVRRPSNIIADFKWCYLIQDEECEFIGYIGELEEQNEGDNHDKRN